MYLILVKNCFVKNISKNRNHRALIYFAVNNHLYLILEDAVRKSLVEKTKVKESFNTRKGRRKRK
jgi:hypothetical protein